MKRGDQVRTKSGTPATVEAVHDNGTVTIRIGQRLFVVQQRNVQR
jgi:preprotein translocase subunit YajC